MLAVPVIEPVTVSVAVQCLVSGRDEGGAAGEGVDAVCRQARKRVIGRSDTPGTGIRGR